MNKQKTVERKKIAVVGGGPAGMCAALSAASYGCAVDLFEQNEKLGKKLYITGKGRCNLTNLCDRESFFDNIVHHPRFLYSAFAKFNQYDLMDLIEESGCPLKVERGNRVFPVTDKSSDIIKAFDRALARREINIHFGAKVKALLTEKGLAEKKQVVGIRLADDSEYRCDHVILATGGLSYSSTGSDGYGFVLAQKLGHQITPCRPSLVGLKTASDWPKELQGLSLRNVVLSVRYKGKVIFHQLGEMLFTHFGVSGPLVLSASAKMDGNPKDYTFEIDLKPALSEQQITQRLIRDIEKNGKKQLINGLKDILPAKMIPVFIREAELDAEKRMNQMSKAERQRIEKCLKKWAFGIHDFESMETAIVTSGGVNVNEINPKTMGSKLIDGLSFAGEMIDVDAMTGGFNIQIAASTGWLAGMSCNQ